MKMSEGHANQRSAFQKLLCIVMTIIICSSLLSGCINTNTLRPINRVAQNSEETVVPQDYRELYDAMKTLDKNPNVSGGNGIAKSTGSGEVAAEDSAPTATLSEESEASPQSVEPTSSSESSYSETNVQVSGIDEADVVKTDGEYIYMISGSDVIIAKAEGVQTREVARITITDAEVQQDMIDENSFFPIELYCSGTTLVILYEYQEIYYKENEENSRENEASSVEESTADECPPPTRYYDYGKSITKAAFYDISDANNPRYVSTLGQDGTYNTSRLQDGILYLISTYTMYDTDAIDADNPSTFVPSYYRNDSNNPVAREDIYIMSNYNAMSYTVVSSIDVIETELIDQVSLFGHRSSVYMSYDNLYLAQTGSKDFEEHSYQEGSFMVTEYCNIITTTLMRLSLNKGDINLEAENTIEGTTLNQFSLDEYKDHLRVVTTVDNYRYRIVSEVGEEGEEVEEYYDDSSYDRQESTNSLYILDSSLEVVGSIEGLAEEERVYSVRFDGPVGYFVTFKQVDPLFAVDLSDVTNPVVKSALKIPGFSTYMHLYKDNRLFGFGNMTNERGSVRGSKLSMFDTSDAYNLKEMHTLNLENVYSSSNNHKAFFIDESNNIIGIPQSFSYGIFGYSDKEGFYLRKEISYADMTADSINARLVRINDYLYLCLYDRILVYQLDSLSLIGDVEINESSSYQESVFYLEDDFEIPEVSTE